MNADLQDREVLAAVFAARVQLAKKSLERVLEEAAEEHTRALAWVQSNSKKEKSFLWYCDEFELEPDAVRRAIREKR